MRRPGTRLLALLTLWLVPLFLLRTGWHLATDDKTRIVDANLTFGGDDPVLVLVTVVWWTWAVLAAIAAVAGRPEPMRRALRSLPVALAALLGALLVFVVGFLAFGLVIPGGLVVGGLALLIVIIVLAPVIARLAVTGPVAVLAQARGLAAFSQASGLVRGQVPVTTVITVFGVVAPVPAIGWLIENTRPAGFVPGVLHWLATDAALVVVAAVQARSLLAAYQDCLPGPGPVATTPSAGPSPRLLAGAGAMLAMSGLLAGGTVALDRLPQVTTLTPSDMNQHLIKVGWPAGRHPIFIGQHFVNDCLDEQCSDVKTTDLSVTMFDPTGSAAIAADGAVFALGQKQLEHCDAQRRCRHTDGLLEILADSDADAVALSAEGDLLIATATAVGERAKATQVELGLVHCRDVLCADSRTTRLGVVQAGMKHSGGWRQQVVALALDSAGRPVVALRSYHAGARDGWPAMAGFTETPPAGPPGELWVARCDTADCRHARVDQPSADDIDDLALLQFDAMLGCLRSDCGPDVPVATIARPQGGAYAVLVEPRERDGFWIRVGERSDEIQATLLVCADATCRQARRIPLEFGQLGSSNLPRPLPSEIWIMAVNPDGRVLLTRPRHNPTDIHVVQP
ncbi:hypothetical protein [Catellatospora paridis]|uniref:hypothetical protein n=1 Tax=Catellatospora paridis TaxID=1617086 RepID=UPI0012D37B60|nr:hypothetical protein [Catellatospora paridis]